MVRVTKTLGVRAGEASKPPGCSPGRCPSSILATFLSCPCHATAQFGCICKELVPRRPLLGFSQQQLLNIELGVTMAGVGGPSSQESLGFQGRGAVSREQEDWGEVGASTPGREPLKERRGQGKAQSLSGPRNGGTVG